MNQKISSGLIAVAFAAALMLAGPAEAGPLTAEPETPSPWSMAWAWLAEVWGDLTGPQDATEPGSFEMSGDLCGTCSSSETGDHGWGIDPNGKP